MLDKLLFSILLFAFAGFLFYGSFSSDETPYDGSPGDDGLSPSEEEVEDYILRPPGWLKKKHIDPVMDPLGFLEPYCQLSSKPDPKTPEGITWAYRCSIYWQQKSGGYFRVHNTQGNPVVYVREPVTVYRATRLEGENWQDNIPKIIQIFNTGMTAPFFRWGSTRDQPILDVWTHVKDFSTETGYLSTSLLKSACLWIINTYYGGSGILYRMKTSPHLGIDVNATLKNSNPVNEHISEVVIPGYVHGYRIEKASVYVRGSKRYEINNKKYNVNAGVRYETD